MGNESSSHSSGGGIDISHFGSTNEPSSEPPPHDIPTKSGLNELYNSQVTSVEPVSRNLNSSGGIIPIPHVGVVLTTESGDRILTHKGDGYGYKGGDTVISDASHMSSAWNNDGDVVHPLPGSMTVGDAVKAGGEDYKYVTDNCIHARANVITRAKEGK